jgi:hypothetical protein
LSRIAASIFPERPVPRRSVETVISNAEIMFQVHLRLLARPTPTACRFPAAVGLASNEFPVVDEELVQGVG